MPVSYRESSARGWFPAISGPNGSPVIGRPVSLRAPTMNCHDYSYCFLRYRRDPEADEFANVGVALWAPESRFLAFRGCSRFQRLTHFFGGLDRDGFRLLMAHVERWFEGLAEQISGDLLMSRFSGSVRELAAQVVPIDDGAVIWSPPRAGITADPVAELAYLYDRFIGNLNERSEERQRRDEIQVFREVYRKALCNPDVAPKLVEHEVVAPLAAHTFKYAWKNGVWNVYETLSFDLLNADSIEQKAHTWFGRSVHLGHSADKPKIHYLLGKSREHP